MRGEFSDRAGSAYNWQQVEIRGHSLKTRSDLVLQVSLGKNNYGGELQIKNPLTG